MPAKQFQFRAEARQSILRGASILADAVRVTLGPKSKCVLIEKKFGRPIVCDDGVTIAKEVELKDPEENLGAQMVREAAERTGEAVGDGTTTSTLLAHAILTEGVRNVAAGASAIDLKRGLTRGLKAAVRFPAGPLPPGDQSSVKRRKWPLFLRTITQSLAIWSPKPSRKSARKAPLPWKNPRPPRRCSKSSKACSSTAASSPPTSLPIPKAWRRPWTSRSF